MLSNSIVAGGTAAAYLVVLVLQINPALPLTTSSSWWLAATIWAAYGVNLAAACYALIVLRLVRGLSCRDVADRLGMRSEAAVHMAVKRAVQRLEKRLNEVDSPAMSQGFDTHRLPQHLQSMPSSRLMNATRTRWRSSSMVTAMPQVTSKPVKTAADQRVEASTLLSTV